MSVTGGTNWQGVARGEIRASREALGLTCEVFARELGKLLDWVPSGAAVASWETMVTPPADVYLAASQLRSVSEVNPGASPFKDVEAVYTSRAESVGVLSPQALFTSSSLIEACGLSLNVVCQQLSDVTMAEMLENGAEFKLLFLRPFGEFIADREREENLGAGVLSALTQLNLDTVRRVWDRPISDDAKSRLHIRTYDDTLRFNIVMVDRARVIVQPYLHRARGIDAPTIVAAESDVVPHGLFQVFASEFDGLWDDGEPVT